jgi:hypothetical protein
MSEMSELKPSSNPSSEVSIEEIGAEEDLAQCEKEENAQEVGKKERKEEDKMETCKDCDILNLT